jgi:hypothetical protein
MAIDILNVPYNTLKIQTTKRGLKLYHITLHNGYMVLAGSVTYVLESIISDNDAIDFDTNLKLFSTAVSCEAEVQGLCSPLEADGKPLVATVSAEGLKRNCISPNWCDRTTWYQESIRVVNESATTSDFLRKVWDVSNDNIIDVYHGKLTGEDDLLDKDGYSYRVSIIVDGTEKIERDPHYGTGGDFTINYSSGQITFFNSIASGKTPLVTYHYENGSLWTIKPYDGEILKIKRAEAQFSEDVDLKDTLIYSVYGSVDSFALQYVYYIATGTATFTNNSKIVSGNGTSFIAQISSGQYIRLESDGLECYAEVDTVNSDTQLTLKDNYSGSSSSGSAAYSSYQSGGYPSGTLIQLVGADKYKTVYDFYNDANGSYPTIPAFSSGNWRGCDKKIYAFPWDFQTTTDFKSSGKMELRVYLEHDTNYTGTYATGTFYTVRVNE